MSRIARFRKESKPFLEDFPRYDSLLFGGKFLWMTSLY